jgi:hypothetical protein
MLDWEDDVRPMIEDANRRQDIRERVKNGLKDFALL